MVRCQFLLNTSYTIATLLTLAQQLSVPLCCAGEPTVFGRQESTQLSTFRGNELAWAPNLVVADAPKLKATSLRHDLSPSHIAILPVADYSEPEHPGVARFLSEDACSPMSAEGYDETLTDECGCDGPQWRPLDTLSLFGGLEGSKQPQDFGVNANFGSRWAANWGFPLLAEYGIGGQIGTSINYTDNAVQVFERIGASTHRTQSFSTLGIFQRTDTWRWGLAYDILYESYYDQFLLGQWRGRVGYATSAADEFGVWGAIPQQRSNGEFLTIPVRLSSLTQGSAYWQHQFSAGPRVMTWAGVAEGHGEVNVALGDFPRTGPQFVFGAEIDVPLNDWFAIYGQANFVGPADTGTVDSFLGVTYYPGGGAFPVARNVFSPFQALANSTMFSVDLRRN